MESETKQAIMKQKSVLRKQVNSRLDSLNKEEILEQSDIVANKVLQHPVYKEATSVSIYLSFDQEIQTDVLLRDIFSSGKICYIPRFRKGIPEMEMIKLHSWEDYTNLPVNKWNIKQPLDTEERESVFNAGSLDLVLMPGLAFTKDGKRLGRGKGYYDGFLTKCFAHLKSRPATLALAFKEQIIPNIPTTKEDVFVDEVIYSDR